MATQHRLDSRLWIDRLYRLGLCTLSGSDLKKSEKPRLTTLRDWLRTYVCGCCMGSADLVPGISGGTVAFILGIYTDLINSIKSLNGEALGALFADTGPLFCIA